VLDRRQADNRHDEDDGVDTVYRHFGSLKSERKGWAHRQSGKRSQFASLLTLDSKCIIGYHDSIRVSGSTYHVLKSEEHLQGTRKYGSLGVSRTIIDTQALNLRQVRPRLGSMQLFVFVLSVLVIATFHLQQSRAFSPGLKTKLHRQYEISNARGNTYGQYMRMSATANGHVDMRKGRREWHEFRQPIKQAQRLLRSVRKKAASMASTIESLISMGKRKVAMVIMMLALSGGVTSVRASSANSQIKPAIMKVDGSRHQQHRFSYTEIVSQNENRKGGEHCSRGDSSVVASSEVSVPQNTEALKSSPVSAEDTGPLAEVRRSFKSLVRSFDNTKIDTLLLLIVTSAVIPLCKRLNVSPIIGFLGAGTLLGPTGLKWCKDVHGIDLLGELGKYLPPKFRIFYRAIVSVQKDTYVSTASLHLFIFRRLHEPKSMQVLFFSFSRWVWSFPWRGLKR
jgi:hypothetical protein